MQILRIAGMLQGGLAHEYGFNCECGCGEIVRLSADDFYLASGAWLDRSNMVVLRVGVSKQCVHILSQELFA